MKKFQVIILLVCFFCTFMFTCSTADNSEVYLVSRNNSVILLTPGQELDCSSYMFEFEDETVRGSELTLSSDDSNLKINGRKISADAEGVFNLKAEYASQSMDILAVSGGTLFYDDFTSDLNEQYRVIEGNKDKVYTKDGFLYVGPSSRVLLPEFLDRIGNYIIECRATIINPNESTRWASVMYRVQQSDYPYYQMCIRSGATASNGVEFAERTPQNQWNVTNTASFTENISPDKLYDIKIEAKGVFVNQYINSVKTQSVNNASSWLKGGIGLQANGSVMKIDSIKITAVQDIYGDQPMIYGYSELNTPIQNDYSSSALIAKPESLEDIQKYADKEDQTRPTAILAEVDSELSLKSCSGKELCSVSELLPLLNGAVMPVFRVKDADTAQKLAQELAEINYPDAYILADAEALKKAKAVNVNFYGALDLSSDQSEINDASLARIRSEVNSAGAKTVLLPQRYADKEYVQFLQKGIITVWLESEAENDAIACRLLVSGANGYVTGSPDNIISAFKYFDKDAMLRRTFVIGHRGIPAMAPENTLEGAIKAYQKGADIVEVDIYVTKDNELVILHDGELSRTTTGRGHIESYTLAELKKLSANNQFPNSAEFADSKIPTMREFFEEFKDTDLGFFIEIKTGKANCCDLLKDLIDEYAAYGMENRCTVISFSMAQIENSRAKLEGVSAGYLCQNLITDKSISSRLNNIMAQLLPRNATFSTAYTGVGKQAIQALAWRGITTWPWTYRNQKDYYSYFKTDAGGLTTDYSNWSTALAHTLNVPAQSVSLSVSESFTASGSLVTYERKSLELPDDAELILISGADVINTDGLSITGAKAGTAVYMIKVRRQINPDLVYTLYSQPVEVTVKAADEAASPSAPAVPAPTDNKALTYIIASCAVIIIAAVIIIVSIAARKKNKKV